MVNVKPETWSAVGHAAITPGTPFGLCRAIFVGVAGDVNVTCAGVSLIYPCYAGQVLNVQATSVEVSGTTASQLRAWF